MIVYQISENAGFIISEFGEQDISHEKTPFIVN